MEAVEAWASTAEAWDELADEVDRQLGEATERMLDAAAPARGDRVLEVAAGPGTLTARLAQAVGPQGRVICSDFAEAMVEVARRRAVGNVVDFRVLDVERLDLVDEAVDVVLCRCGLMLVPDPAAALQECARVLAPGGRLALAVWGEAQANPWAALPMRAVAQAVGAAPPPAGAPGLWSLADEERLHRLLAGAGFAEPRVERVDGTVDYRSPADWLERTSRLAAPLRALLAGASPEARARVAAELDAAAAPFRRPGGGLAVPQRLLVASGTRP